LATSAKLGHQVEVETILDAMERRQDEIAATVAARLLAEVDGYQVWHSSDLSAQFIEQCRQHIRLLLSMARTGRAPKSAELDSLLKKAREHTPPTRRSVAEIGRSNQ
jgi:hypothetical protein